LVEAIATRSSTISAWSTKTAGEVRITRLAFDVYGAGNDNITTRKDRQRLIVGTSVEGDGYACRNVNCREVKDAAIRNYNGLRCGWGERSVGAGRTAIEAVLCGSGSDYEQAKDQGSQNWPAPVDVRLPLSLIVRCEHCFSPSRVSDDNWSNSSDFHLRHNVDRIDSKVYAD
jgi:hypothetical protein